MHDTCQKINEADRLVGFIVRSDYHMLLSLSTFLRIYNMLLSLSTFLIGLTIREIF